MRRKVNIGKGDTKSKTNGGWQYGRFHMRNPNKTEQVLRVGHYVNPLLNRSSKWKYARSYQEARDKSPWPERPVR